MQLVKILTMADSTIKPVLTWDKIWNEALKLMLGLGNLNFLSTSSMQLQDKQVQISTFIRKN